MSTVANPYIEIPADGHPRICGTGFKVRILAEEYLHGMTPADLRESHPQLSLSQIHGALAYYYDHKNEFDREIEQLNRFAESFFAQQGESLAAKKLRELGDDVP
ncbi:MAG: DUF433 domain-containing protein [Pirellulales bacterium]